MLSFCALTNSMCVHLLIQAMGVSVEAIYLFYSIVGAIIFVVMSSLAGAALRSTKTQVKRHHHPNDTFMHSKDYAENYSTYLCNTSRSVERIPMVFFFIFSSGYYSDDYISNGHTSWITNKRGSGMTCTTRKYEACKETLKYCISMFEPTACRKLNINHFELASCIVRNAFSCYIYVFFLLFTNSANKIVYFVKRTGTFFTKYLEWFSPPRNLKLTLDLITILLATELYVLLWAFWTLQLNR